MRPWIARAIMVCASRLSVSLSPQRQLSRWIAFEPVAVGAIISYNEAIWVVVPGT